MLLTTGGALGVTLLALVALQVALSPSEMKQRIGSVGGVIAQYTLPALEFEDPDAAAEALSALAALPEAQFGLLLRVDGSEFARWGSAPTGLDVSAIAATSGFAFTTSEVDWVRPIERDGQRLGTLVIRSGLSGLVSRILQITALLFCISLISLAVAWGIAARLREQIAAPLGELSASAEALAAGDLSKTVAVGGNDEIGALGTSFNRMAERLRALIAQARGSSLAVSEETARLSSAGEQMFEEARRQERATIEQASSVERLSGSVSEINTTAHSLADAASESDRAMSQVDNSIQHSARSIDSLFGAADLSASSVLEMSASAKQIAENASHLSGATAATQASMSLLQTALREVEANARRSHASTTQAAETAQRGETAVGESIAGMREIEESFAAVERIVGELAKRSKAIDAVIEVITSVVDETNLLALNAAIIAAQAGERGKSFAVVASEVKSLARRTGASAGEIRASIGSLLQGVDDAVRATASGAKLVREGTRRSEEAGASLRAIRESADRSSGAVSEIAAATGTQVQGVGAVVTELERVRVLVDQIAQATREQERASGEIHRSVEEVRELAEDLKRATGEQTTESRRTSDAVRLVAAGLSQIRDASEKQSRETARILESVHVFRDGAAEGTKRAESMHATVKELRKRSQALEQEIGRFRS